MSDITYKIEIDEIEGDTEFWNYPKEKIRYFLDDKPWEFIPESDVKIGDFVSYNIGELEKCGIVTNIRRTNFTYYDVGFTDSLRIEEVAMFQVFKNESRNIKADE